MDNQPAIHVVAFDGDKEVDFSISLHPESSKQDVSNELHRMMEKVREALALPPREEGPQSELPRLRGFLDEYH